MEDKLCHFDMIPSRLPDITHLVRRERGVGLLEALIGVAILVIASVAYVGALSTSYISVNHTDRRITAEIVARSQLEHTKSQSYEIAPHSYPSITDIPDGYSVSSDATAIPDRDDNIQRITVDVQVNGSIVVSIEDFKTNR